MKRSFCAAAVGVLSVALAIPGVSRAETVATGTLSLRFLNNAPGPEQAQFVHGGCAASVQSGVFQAVINVKRYAGKKLKLTFKTPVATVPGGVEPGVWLAYADECEIQPTDGLQAAGIARTGEPFTWTAKGTYVVLTHNSERSAGVGYALATA